ncbi:MAG TPA: hypothetical protein VFS77_02610 [Pyrinomonadaceae bacterium]|nr:hypothetical protein [Pyrinomonadaceae bacterium]
MVELILVQSILVELILVQLMLVQLMLVQLILVQLMLVQLILVQFANTPKAFANSSPMVGAQRQPWDPRKRTVEPCEGVR